jgi:anti-sigma factor (TIGR02949 family)
MSCKEAESYLNQYLDGELDVIAALRFEQHLTECAACADQYGALQELRREIRNSGLYYSLPPTLRRRVAAAHVVPWWRRVAPIAAAVVAVLVLLLVPAWMLLRTPSADGEIVDSHLRSLMAAHLVDVSSSNQHTVKPWFQGKLPFSPDVPDLSAQGFNLIGGRLDVVQHMPSAAIVYKVREHVINLFVVASGPGESSPAYSKNGGFHIVHWANGGMNYWAVSDVNPADLRTFAELVRSP